MRLLLLLLLLPFAAAPQTPQPQHAFHVSYGRMVVEGEVALLRIRFFTDDLELTLGTHHKRPGYTMDISPTADSLFLSYFAERFVLKHGAQPLTGQIVGSGEEEDMWWYLIQYEHTTPLADLNLYHTMLFETFDDQRNIVKVLHMASEKQRSYYFVEGADTYPLRAE